MNLRTPRIALSLAATAALAWAGPAAAETPQTDGTVNVSTVYRTLDATTWDLQRWTWKGNHDNLQMESLLRGDLQYGAAATKTASSSRPTFPTASWKAAWRKAGK